MAKQAQKHTNAVSLKKHDSATQPAKFIQKAAGKTFEIERESAENILRSAENYTRGAVECMSVCSENVSALAESGNMSSFIFRNMSNEIIKNCNQAISESLELSRDIFACRRYKDMIELQNKVAQQLCDSYFNTGNKLREIVFESCTDTLESIQGRVALASEQFLRPLAA